MSLVSGAERIAVWSGAQGELEVSRPRRNVVYIRIAGNVEQSAGKVLADALRQGFEAAGPRLDTFWELGELVSYHSDLRVLATNTLLKFRPNLNSLHTYSTSKVVAMGVAVANLALGGIITAHKSRESFDAALAMVVEK